MARQMKESGIEWIGEIPEAWQRDKVVRTFSLIGSGTTPKSTDEEQYGGPINWIQSGDINGGVMSSCKNTITEQTLQEYSALKVYQAPFIILAMYGASVGNLSISTIDGCVNQACCVLSMSKCNFQYAFYTLKAAKEYLLQKAVGGGQPNISQDIIRSLWTPQPELEEQHRIADFLDRRCAEIDAVIERTKATIEEYKKLKQAVITEAVTKGVRGPRPMKDSGIEWIGEIPEEWEVLPHKYVMHKDKSICEHYAGEDIISLTMNGVIVRDLTAGGKMPTTFDGYQYVEPDDMLLCLFDIDVTPRCVGIVRNYGVTSPAYSRFKVHVGYYNAYYDYLLRFIDDEKVFIHLSKNLRSSLTETDFGAIKTISPSYDEQVEIAAYLDEKCAALDTLIAKKTALLTELEAYKKSLIYEYVTGKKEVPACP